MRFLTVINDLILALGCACLAAAVLAQCGRVARPFDVLSHFAPLYLLGSLGCALWGAVLAGGATGRCLLAVGAFGAVAAAILIAPEMLRPGGPHAPPAAARRLRLIQFNAWALNRDAALAAEWIASQKPDVITVEELMPPLRAALRAQGFHEQRGNIPSIAIFGRVVPLPAPFMAATADWPVPPEIACATFRAPGGEGVFDVVAVHLAWPTAPGAWPQALRMAEFLNLYETDRLIVAGDFNLTPWSFALRQLDRRLGIGRRDRALPTWPARVSVRGRFYDTPACLPIDHVYAGSAWRTVAVRRGPSIGSDHYPLIVDLALTRQAGQRQPHAVTDGTDTGPGGCRPRCLPTPSPAATPG
jgi:endonuclease/exonuclease/phosphatase (EEP) superfamily protein YafD